LLILCARDATAFDASDATRLLARTSPEIVLALADYHGVAGLAYERLRSLDSAPETLIRDLHARYTSAVQGHLRVIWELAKLRPVLDATGARWAVIKGPAVVELLYSAPGQRAYQDLDLLVEPGSFRDVLATLEASGSELMDRNWETFRKEMLGEVHLRLPRGTSLDLHWNLINMNRGRMWIDGAEVLSRVTRRDLGGVVVPIMDPADTLVHLAVHAALSGGDRLLWLKDLDLAARVDLPWEAVVERAHRWNVAAPTGLMLARTRQVLDASIPEWVTSRLLGSGTARLVRLVERASPWELSVGRLTAASHIVSRSVSLGPIGASMWFVRRSLRSLDPREPAASSAFTPRGDDADRQAFIDAVVHWRTPSGVAPPGSGPR
jgi:hypothetical protein